MQGKTLMKTVTVIAVAVMIIAVAVFLCFELGWIVAGQTAYPSPQYQVDSFADLQEKLISSGKEFILPDAELIGDRGHGFLVKLKDRFREDIVGYGFSVYVSDDKTDVVSINCELIKDHVPSISATEYYNGIAIQIHDQKLARFIYGDCYFEVSCSNAEARSMMIHSVIDNGTG